MQVNLFNILVNYSSIYFQPEVTVLDISVWMCTPCKAKQQINRLQATNSVSSTIVPKVIKLPYDVCFYHNYNCFFKLLNMFANLNIYIFLVKFSTMGHTPSY